jgi:hypothetical protein
LGAAVTTSNRIVQLPFVGIVPPDRLPFCVPSVTAPHVDVRFGGDAKASCAVMLNVVATFVRATVLGLLSVIVTVLTAPFCKKPAGADTMPVTGWLGSTASVAEAAEPLLPCDDVTSPALIVLV